MVKKIEMKEKLLENFIPSFGKACRAAFMRGISSAGKGDSIAKAMLSCKIEFLWGGFFDMHALRVDSVVHQVACWQARSTRPCTRASEMLFIGGIVGAHVVGKIFGERRVVGFSFCVLGNGLMMRS